MRGLACATIEPCEWVQPLSFVHAPVATMAARRASASARSASAFASAFFASSTFCLRSIDGMNRVDNKLDASGGRLHPNRLHYTLSTVQAGSPKLPKNRMVELYGRALNAQLIHYLMQSC